MNDDSGQQAAAGWDKPGIKTCGRVRVFGVHKRLADCSATFGGNSINLDRA